MSDTPARKTRTQSGPWTTPRNCSTGLLRWCILPGVPHAAPIGLLWGTGARWLFGAVGALGAGCFNPTSYDTTSEPSVTSDTSVGPVAIEPSGTTDASSGSATAASSSSTSATSTTTASTSSPGTSEQTTSACSPCCGDGEINLPTEECDDGNVMDKDACSADCRKEFRLVFVTNETFAGDLGGSQGADEKCQIAAMTAGLSGVFRAWLSTSAQQPLDSLVPSTVPYRRLDGVQVAKDWADLVDGMLENPINYTETMIFVPGPACEQRAVWTASFDSGTEYDAAAKSCSDWTSTAGTTTGGNPSLTNAWSDGCPLSCAGQASLYCVEQ